MRSEQEMLDLILNTARKDERIRAVIMNGSRANPHAPRDIFQDFDIVYLVSEVASFIDDLAWIRRFGNILIMQRPEAIQDPPLDNDGSFTYLMQFTDGNHIDLCLRPLTRSEEVERNSLSLLYHPYTLMFLRKGPAPRDDENRNERLQQEHLQYLSHLQDAGKLVLNGPILAEAEILGVSVYADPLEEARALAEAETKVKAAYLTVEALPWMAFSRSEIEPHLNGYTRASTLS